MPCPEFSRRTPRPVAIFLATLILAASALGATPTEKVLYSFQGGNDGANPSSNLIADKEGNLYGTTTYGGTGQCTNTDGFVIGCGTVFKLVSPSVSGGKWTEKILYSFQGFGNGADSGYPLAGLAFDAAGNLYGTTSGNTGYADYGTVFELSPPTTKAEVWTKTILHAFQGGYDGASPQAGVVFDSKGQLYGSTNNGTPFSAGTIFRLTPPATSGGAWTETVLYSFAGGADGQNPAGVIIDARGNIYGTTAAGGGFSFGGDQYSDYWSGGGTFFELTPATNKGKPWNESQAFVFPPCIFNDYLGGGSCGANTQPEGTLISDAAGNLYGTSELGGDLSVCDFRFAEVGCGTVFQFVPPAVAGGAWTQNVLYQFSSTSAPDGAFPLGSLSFDSSGNLYGTTSDCSAYGCITGFGEVFELSPPTAQGGTWTETVLYQLQGGSDGILPVAGVLVRGNVLYSTTQAGGAGNCLHTTSQPAGCGTVFAVTH